MIKQSKQGFVAFRPSNVCIRSLRDKLGFSVARSGMASVKGGMTDAEVAEKRRGSKDSCVTNTYNTVWGFGRWNRKKIN